MRTDNAPPTDHHNLVAVGYDHQSNRDRRRVRFKCLYPGCRWRGIIESIPAAASHVIFEAARELHRTHGHDPVNQRRRQTPERSAPPPRPQTA